MRSIFFLGIGGIGVSALARYFHSKGYTVAGYDRTPSPLTRELEAEGIPITYTEDLSTSQLINLSTLNCLVVRTPAVPEDEAHYTYFREHGFTIIKRAELLGQVTEHERALCVAGTHGKTTTSTLLAHLLKSSHVGTNAFLGGISNNYNTNLLMDDRSNLVVVEADEYDRSFHHLRPYMSIITSIDPDHLDIYGTAEAYQEGFDYYASLVEDTIVLKHGYHLDTTRLKAKVYTYTGQWSPASADPATASTETAPDFYADNIRVADGTITFDFRCSVNLTTHYSLLNTQYSLLTTHHSLLNTQYSLLTTIRDLRLGVPVWVNIENSVAAIALALLNGVTPDEIRAGLASFKGVYRRFNIHVNTPQVAYVDDYAHHPTELHAAIQSIRALYPDRYFIAVFQPHLYTRTRDFAADFKKSLGEADELILLPIYPAREEPIPGVTSAMLGGTVVEKADLISTLQQRIADIRRPVVIATLGAGDIDRLVPDITRNLKLET